MTTQQLELQYVTIRSLYEWAMDVGSLDTSIYVSRDNKTIEPGLPTVEKDPKTGEQVIVIN